MYPTSQIQQGYPPHRTIPPPAPPPLTVPPQLSQPSFPYSNASQMPSNGQVPASPRSEKSREEDLSSLPGPPPTSTLHNGFVWALDIVQQPVRARMCGFGDKDRRPISPPPCIRLIIMDPRTKQEIDPKTVDLQFFVLTVDLWDAQGNKEVNLVRHAQNSPSISTAHTITYPPTRDEALSAQHHPIPYDVNNIPTYSQSSLVSPQSAQPQSSHQPYYSRESNSITNGQGNGTPMYHTHQQYPYTEHRYGSQLAYTNGYPPSIPGFSSLPNAHSLPAIPATHYQTNGPHLASSQTTGMYTRNLIGSLSTSASALVDMEEKQGIWFILQDLSVRTEGWFRLKATFVDIGTASTVDRDEQMNGNKPTQQLVAGTAPVLATVFSKPFQVFSAKKFPGVIESTALSRTFARQGVKIPIRKDPGVKSTRGRNDQDGSDEEAEFPDDQE